MGGALAAAATAPALLKAKAASALGFDPIINPWYRTTLDEPRWHSGYEPLSTDTKVIERLSKEAFLRREESHFEFRADIMRPDAEAALDKALNDAFAGHRKRDGITLRDLARDFDAAICRHMGKAGYRPATQPEFHMSAYLRRFGPIERSADGAMVARPFKLSETVLVTASDLEMLQNTSCNATRADELLDNLAKARVQIAFFRGPGVDPAGV